MLRIFPRTPRHRPGKPEGRAGVRSADPAVRPSASRPAAAPARAPEETVFLEAAQAPRSRETAVTPRSADLEETAILNAAPRNTPEKAPPTNGKNGSGYLRHLFDYAPDAYYLSDMRGTFVDGNLEAERMLGYKREELIGKTYLAAGILPAAQIPRATTLLARNAFGKATGPDEFTLRRKDGTPVTVEIRTFPTSVNGRTLILGIARDITRRKRYEEEISAWKRRFELVIAASGQVVYDYDLSTGEIIWSGSLEQVLGYDRSEMGGIEEWTEMIHPEDRAEAVRLLEDAEREQAVYDVDYRFRHRDGGYRWIHDRGFFLIEEGRNVRRMIGMMQDISDRKQAELLQSAVYRIAQSADSSDTLDDLFRSVHETVATVMPAGNFYIALYDESRDLISFPYFVDEEDAPPAPLKPSKGLTEYVLRTGKPLLCDEATDRELRGRGEVEVVGAPSAIWLGAPLIVDGRTIGVMVVQHYSDPRAYGQAERRMLEFVSSQVARSIERKRAEEALRESEQRISHHVQHTPLAAIEWDTDFRVLQWNPAAERIFGYPAEEARGRHASFIVPEAYREHVDHVWNGLLSRRGGERSTNENVTKDGRTIFCEWYNTSLIDARGRVVGVASLAQDVTTRKQAEEALRDSEELYRKLVSSIPDMIIRTDLRGDIVFANKVGVRLSGFGSMEEFVGRNIMSFVAPEDLARTAEAWKAMFEKRLPPHEIGLVFQGRAPIKFEVDGAVLRNPEGTPYGVVFVCRDITERKLAEERLRKGLDKLRATLKASIDSLASAIEMRDPYTAGHQERVTRLARAIAEEMGLEGERLEAIEVAGVIHDIGKLYVPAEILSKPTKLTEIEYALIKMHAQAGYTILSKIDFPWPIADIVHQHHEYLNGSGYPQGLHGKDILLEAKILCVADVAEAMSSHRPYRPALGIQAALEEISQKRGILYDREVVDACLTLFREKNFKFD
jgi:PAS domain S-box-containing protein/putative nucleotidyltransferase with HDIG domain